MANGNTTADFKYEKMTFLFSPAGVGWGLMSADCPRSVKLAMKSSPVKREIFQPEAFSKVEVERGQPLTRSSNAQTIMFGITFSDFFIQLKCEGRVDAAVFAGCRGFFVSSASGNAPFTHI